MMQIGHFIQQLVCIIMRRVWGVAMWLWEISFKVFWLFLRLDLSSSLHSFSSPLEVALVVMIFSTTIVCYLFLGFLLPMLPREWWIYCLVLPPNVFFLLFLGFGPDLCPILHFSSIHSSHSTCSCCFGLQFLRKQSYSW